MNSLLHKLACAIAAQEGWFASGPNVPKQLNNPGDIEYAGQAGAMPRIVGNHTFAQWPTPAAGIVGLQRDLLAKIAAGMSLRQIISVWAPPHENDTAAYLANVQKWAGVISLDTPLMNEMEALVDPRTRKAEHEV